MNKKIKVSIIIASILGIAFISERAIRLDNEYKAKIAKIKKEREEEKQLLNKLNNLSGPVYCHGNFSAKKFAIEKIQTRIDDIRSFRLQVEGPESIQVKEINSKPEIKPQIPKIDFVSRVEE